MKNNEGLNALVSGLKIDGIPNVGELEEIYAYLGKKGLTSDKEKLDYLREMDPVSIDNSLKELGVTPTNLAGVTEEFKKFLDFTQRTSKSLQDVFQSITRIQSGFAGINKMLQNNVMIQSGLSKAVQNLILTPKITPELSDLISKMATSQVDWSKMTVPKIDVDWSKITTVPKIDAGTTPDASKVMSKILEEAREKSVKAAAEDIELERYEEGAELLKGVAGVITVLELISSSTQQSSEALTLLVSSTDESKKIQDESRKWQKWALGGIVATVILGIIGISLNYYIFKM